MHTHQSYRHKNNIGTAAHTSIGDVRLQILNPPHLLPSAPGLPGVNGREEGDPPEIVRWIRDLEPAAKKLAAGFLLPNRFCGTREMTMTDKIEIRVRPVNRHLVTVWVEGAGSRLIGEFESPSIADEVALALQAKTPRATVVSSEGAVVPGSDAQYLIVPAENYNAESIVYYADSEDGAIKKAHEASVEHSQSFKIFSCLAVAIRKS